MPNKYTKRRFGRPTTYNEDYQKKADEYIDNWQPDPENGKSIPSIVSLSLYLNVARETLYEWAVAQPTFSRTLQRIRDKQREITINRSLSGEYNSTIAKLLLSCNHNMHETTKTANKVAIVSADELSDDELASIIAGGK